MALLKKKVFSSKSIRSSRMITSVKIENDFHYAIRPILLMGRFFAYFPLNGISSYDPHDLRFTWKSFVVFYWILISIGTSICIAYQSYIISNYGLRLDTIGGFHFFATSLVRSVMLFNFARRWPNFILFWQKTEQKFYKNYYIQDEKSLSLSYKLRIINLIVMIPPLVEHVLFLTSDVWNALKNSSSRDETDPFAIYFASLFPKLNVNIVGVYALGITVRVVSLVCTFGWHFMDLIIILISFTLTSYFKQLNKVLREIEGKIMPEWWWKIIRADYTLLALMTRRADTEISKMIFMSFFVNLYIICIQLFNSVKPLSSMFDTLFFIYSLSILFARVLAVTLSAADIHASSHLPVDTLYRVPKDGYSREIEKFIFQVTHDQICLTGMKMFSITRSLFLTVASTILTYEIILLQVHPFGDDKPNNVTNSTA